MKPSLLLCALLLTSCHLTDPHSDIFPYIKDLRTTVDSTAPAGSPVHVDVNAAVLMASNANVTSMNYELELGVCVFEGAVPYTPALAQQCLAQQTLPEGVTLVPTFARSTIWADTNKRGESKAFAFGTQLSFSKAGTYTVMGSGKSWYDNRQTEPNPTITAVDETPRVIMIR